MSLNRPERKYVLDTNLFIKGFRDASANLELQRFHAVFAPFEYFSVIVAQELRSGVHSQADRKALEKLVLGPYSRRSRILVPSERAWHESGDILAELADKEGLEIGKVSKSFANDILLALSCRESGMVLVTENITDFKRISRVAPFEFTEPWPEPES
jgi:predicted nucleic acid-binding protein